MFRWLLDWQWARNTASRRSDGSLEAAKSYALRQGKKYRATITLQGLDSWAGNDTVAEKLTEAGFKEVKITGDGYVRKGEGRWGKPDTTAEVDPRLSEITEIV